MTFVRVDVWGLAEDDPIVVWYGKAVAAMKAKPTTDPTSWGYQAGIHGTTSQTPPAAWNQCQHYSWFFVSWHRMYLYYFERIVRAEVIAQGGPANWALPYWNYDGGTDHNQLPLAFRNPTLSDGTANPLYTADRNSGINTGAGLSPSITTPSFALSRPTFTGASEFGGGVTTPIQFFSEPGALEQTPHNVVHNAIGGLMGDPDTAALDPIFWLHHANIDRIWWLWQRSHAETTDPEWTAQGFPFPDVGGAPSSLTASGVLNTTQQLHYTYDHLMIQLPWWWWERWWLTVRWPGPWPERVQLPAEEVGAAARGGAVIRQLVGASEQPVRLVGETTQVPVTIDSRAVEAVRADGLPKEHRVFLDLDDIEAERNPGTVYGIYVNLPDSPSAADLQVHHVGNLSLFGVERARAPIGKEHGHSLHTSMDITDLLDRLAALGQWTDGSQLAVTFLPISLEPPPGGTAKDVPSTAHTQLPITVGRVSVHYA